MGGYSVVEAVDIHDALGKMRDASAYSTIDVGNLKNLSYDRVCDIIKAQGENTIAVVDRVKVAVNELQSQLPQGVTLSVVRDSSTAIRNSVRNVQRNLHRRVETLIPIENPKIGRASCRERV
mgnify:CR=1 FL=1